MSHLIEKTVAPAPAMTARRKIMEALTAAPLPPDELLRNLGLYLLPMEMKRFLFLDSLYRQIVNVPGVIFEFGVRWGQNLSVFQSLRAIYEPYNHLRQIVGFDTFEGFASVHKKDGNAAVIAPGAYGVAEGYDAYLDNVLSLKETQSPLDHLKKFRLIKGDAAVTLKKYLREHPETIVALAYFDMDLYEPTAKCLELLKGHLTRGSILGFDELNHPSFPGETTAVREVLGLDKIRLQRNAWCANESYLIIE